MNRRVPTARRAPSWPPLLGIAAGMLLATACKAPGQAKTPGADISGWSLDEIEAELARNDDALASAGIMIATATVPAPMGEAAVEQEAGGDAIESDESAEEEGPPPEPEPEPEIYDDDHDAAPTVVAPASRDHAEAEEDAPAMERRSGRRERRASARRDSSEPPSRCERVCDLAEATCDLEVQICELAERHPGELRYQQACARAELQCQAASDACDRCEED